MAVGTPLEHTFRVMILRGGEVALISYPPSLGSTVTLSPARGTIDSILLTILRKIDPDSFIELSGNI